MAKEPRERFRPADLVHAFPAKRDINGEDRTLIQLFGDTYRGHFFVNEYHVVDGDKRND
jgi:hypothetical protein